MFKHPFSAEGRIRRTEFGLSCIISGFLNFLSNVLAIDESTVIISLVISLPNLWFMLAQGAKRCHDLGHSGWWQIIPFYSLWLLFQDGDPKPNEYGNSPKYPAEYSTPAREMHNVIEKHQASAQTINLRTQRMDVKTIVSHGDHVAIGRLVDNYGYSYPLSMGINTIGRADSSSNATIQISTEDRYMSRNHAVVEVIYSNRELLHRVRFGENRQVSIFHNGNPINDGVSVRLLNGDKIRLGHTDLVFSI